MEPKEQERKEMVREAMKEYFFSPGRKRLLQKTQDRLREMPEEELEPDELIDKLGLEIRIKQQLAVIEEYKDRVLKRQKE